MSDSTCDVLIVGAGAAGLAAAIFLRMRNPALRVRLVDGARMPGAKILVSGGGRCNVTNTVVTERDYWGGSRSIIRRVLRGLTVRETVQFFAAAGVPLHEEHDGKLFPDSNRARDVLEALLRLTEAHGVERQWPCRVHSIRAGNGRLVAATAGGEIAAARVVLATGGQSLPKSGSDGEGFRLAQSLGHTIVPPTPALSPLLLSGDGSGGTRSLHEELSGVSLDATLTVWVGGRTAVRLRESLLWTHFGISGPVALNASRHFLRAVVEGREVRVTANLVGDRNHEAIEQLWLERARDRPSSLVSTTLAGLLPSSMASAIQRRLGIDAGTAHAELRRDDRRRLTRALTEWPLPVSGSRGYNYAEATAGGVDLSEIDPGTLQSRRCPSLYLIGEVLDVDGRIGGFNFQWAWSSAAVAARALAGPAR